MPTFDLRKECERCQASIPDEYQNLLCDKCYAKVVQENEQRKKDEEERLKKIPDSTINPANIQPVTPVNDKEVKKAPEAPKPPPDERFGIDDPKYQFNEEKADKDQILANLAQFIYSHNPDKSIAGKMLWYPTRNMYTFIKHWCMDKIKQHEQYPKWLWKPKIVDIGCGSGVGSNIMSQEADFVWGIDNNEFSIEFANECFTREKNGIYYAPQVTFDVIDIMTENREMMKFDIVAAIEIIEHIYDTYTFLKNCIQFTKRDKRGRPLAGYDATTFFISTPNRNFRKLQKDKPKNPFHVREWTSQEYHKLLSKYFSEVIFRNNKGKKIEVGTDDEIIFAECRIPKI